MFAVFAAGLIIVYLLGLFPVFLICLRKRLWVVFFAGFVTLGLIWWVGATTGESRRRIGAVAAALACAVLAIGVVAARPGQFFGVGGKALGNSVGGLVFKVGSCRHLGGREWSCARSDGSSVLDYRVRVSPLGCWRGVEEAGRNLVPARRIAGCVHFEDYF
jgi:hypothetical protein